MKVHVKSFGCSANHAEAEIIKGQYKDTLSEENDADMIVLNICTVKGDKNALDEIKKVKEQYPNKKITVTGCITPTLVEPIKKIDPDVRLVNTHNILSLPILVKKKEDAMNRATPIKLLQPRVRMNSVVGIIPISSGCLDACAFCSTRLVKGALVSYPESVVVDEVKRCVAEGCKELWITGQDTCCYGFDKGTNLARLLKKIVDVPGDFMVRVGMGNPRHVPKYQEEFIEIMKHPKIFKFVHLPVQAGSNNTLKHMRRGHTVETFVDIVKKLRAVIPEITISTDIIVGHPGETDDDFEQTVRLVEELQIDNVNLARFQARPGTEAFKMPQVHGNISKERSGQLNDVYMDVTKKQNKKWIGWTGEVIVDEKIKDGMGARNYAYKQIVIRKNVPLGSKVKVKITEADTYFLVGELL